jgi:hypothetical protein
LAGRCKQGRIAMLGPIERAVGGGAA